MKSYSYLMPIWFQVLGRHGRLGLLSLLYLRRRLDNEGLYPAKVSDSTILCLIASRHSAWDKPMKWDAGPADVNMFRPEGVKAWLDRDISDFKRLCGGEVDNQLSYCHAHAAMVHSNRMKSLSA